MPRLTVAAVPGGSSSTVLPHRVSVEPLLVQCKPYYRRKYLEPRHLVLEPHAKDKGQSYAAAMILNAGLVLIISLRQCQRCGQVG